MNVFAKIKNWFIGDKLSLANDEFEIARIQLTYNFTFFFLILGLAFYGKLIHDHLLWQIYLTTFGIVSVVIVFIAIKASNSIKPAAIIYLTGQIIMSVGNIVLTNASSNIMAGFWMLLYVLFAFFVLGNMWGYLMTVLTAIIIFTSEIIKNYNLLDTIIPDSQILNEDTFFAIIPFALNVYIIREFVRTNKIAENTIKEHRTKIQEKNKEITDSINYASRIQSSILPPDDIWKKMLPDSFVLYLPKDIVSGDFYWIEKNGNNILFSAVDCTGHGVPGAMMSVVGLNLLQDAVHDRKLNKPSDILSHLDWGVNNTLRQQSEGSAKDGMDLALCNFNPSTLELQYAGVQNSLYYISNGELFQIKADKSPIGVNNDGIVDEYNNHTVQLQKGDCVYLFSDGFADQFGGVKGKKYKYSKFRNFFLAIHKLPMEEQHQALLKEFDKWKGDEEQVDDVCIIGIRA